MTKKQDDVAAVLAAATMLADATKALGELTVALKAAAPAQVAPTRGRPRTRQPVVPVAVATVAVVPPPPSRPVTSRDRIEFALKRETLDAIRLSKTVGDSLEEVTRVLKQLGAEGKIANRAAPDLEPRWTWRIGNDTPTRELTKVIERLLWELPAYERDLIRLTGARQGRVQGVLIELRRKKRVKNIAQSGRAILYAMAGDRPDTSGTPLKANSRSK